MSTVTFSGSGELTQSTVNTSLGSATIVIIEGYSSIGSNAFSGKSQITTVTIPNSVTSIGQGAFINCSALTSVTLPINNSFTTIRTNTFYFCSKLTSITIPSSVQTISDYVFYYCSKLTSITIPNSVTSIGASTFLGCSALTSIDVDSANTTYSSLDGVLFNKVQTTLIVCPGGFIGSFNIPNSVQTISAYAFQNCSALTSVTLPINNSFTTIHTNTFQSCSALTTITIPNSVTTIGSDAFYSCSKLESITIPNSVTSIGATAFFSCTALASVIIGNSVTSIGSYAFYNCVVLASVTFNGNIPTIGTSNFTATNDTAYYYEGATNTSRLSPFFTNIVVIVPQPAPVITSITTSSQTATINFTQGSNTGAQPITSYQYSTDSGTTWVTALQTTSPIIVTGLTNDATYNFAIRNYNGFNSAASNIINATILSIPQPAPVITSITTSTNGAATINFTQTTIVASAVTSYQYSTDSGTTWVTALQTSGPIVVTGLTNGTTYNFIIRNNNGLYSDNSNASTVTISVITTATLIGAGELSKNIIDSIQGISTISFININNSYTSISSNAFLACAGDVNISLPSSITNIGETLIKGDGMTIGRTTGIVQWQSTKPTRLFSNTGSFITANTLFA